MTRKVLLELQDVCKHFGSFVAVNNVSFTVKSGTIMGILGPNGAGKTTLLSMLIGLFPSTSGVIILNGVGYTSTIPAEAKTILGFVPDSQETLEHLTGWEYLEFIRRVYHLSDIQWSVVEDYLGLLRMDSKIHDLMQTYSHGQCKKIQFISALLHNPAFLILDEPFSGLDPEMVALTKALIRKLCERGVGVLLSTHDLAMAEGLCDSVVLMNHGAILAQGQPEQLLTDFDAKNLEHAFLKALGLEEHLEDIDRVLASF
ncbi:MAG: hypothetical protein GFH24_608346n29 [Chloroflexi bacterium AL-N5]|nr:hypothetical protein [Chloroflexi bacterium AL-N5]